MNYIDGIFSPYEDLHVIKELKEELSNDLQEKMNDLKNKGYDEVTAYNMTIDSIGDISEIIESISAKARELKQMLRQDFSNINLQNSDFKGVTVHDGEFNTSALKESDFSDSDLTNTSLKGCYLINVIFDGANLTGVKLTAVSLKYTSLKSCIFDGATMNKLTYAVLKGSKANLTNVTVI